METEPEAQGVQAEVTRLTAEAQRLDALEQRRAQAARHAARAETLWSDGDLDGVEREAAAALKADPEHIGARRLHDLVPERRHELVQ